MIAVTFAHPSESRAFLRRFRDLRGKVEVLHTGIGASACRRRLTPLLAGGRFDLLISSGFAGAVDDSLGVGDLIVAENFSTAGMLEKAQALVPCAPVTLASATRVLESASARRAFAAEHGASAVDMETQTIAELCAARNLPLLSLRVISDSPAAPLPAPAEVLFDLVTQQTRLGRLVPFVLGHPVAIPRLIRFGAQIVGARRVLALALLRLVRELS